MTLKQLQHHICVSNIIVSTIYIKIFPRISQYGKQKVKLIMNLKWNK